MGRSGRHCRCFCKLGSDLIHLMHHAKDCELADVHSQAWLMAMDRLAGRGETVDFRHPGFQDLLISFLYQHFVRYDDRRLRYSVRFEQAQDDDSGHCLRSFAGATRR